MLGFTGKLVIHYVLGKRSILGYVLDHVSEKKSSDFFRLATVLHSIIKIERAGSVDPTTMPQSKSRR